MGHWSGAKFIFWGEGGAIEESPKIGVQVPLASSRGYGGSRDSNQGSPGRPPKKGGEAGAGLGLLGRVRAVGPGRGIGIWWSWHSGILLAQAGAHHLSLCSDRQGTCPRELGLDVFLHCPN